MKKITTIGLFAISAIAFAGCETTTNTNTNVRTNANANSNTIIVTNANSANTSNMNSNSNSNRSMTREDYDKDKNTYAEEAKKAGRTIGQGVNDGWLWTKTRADLLATDDLRESTINVDVSNDVVTLSGSVASKAQSDKAVSVAKGIEGVKDVKNNLKVQANDSLTNQMVNGNSNTKANTNTK